MAAAVADPLLPPASLSPDGIHTTTNTTRGRVGQRLIARDGRSNVLVSGVDDRLRRYLIDSMTSLAELPFYYHVTAFAVALFVSWTVFGLFWWLMAAAHGDLVADDQLYLLEERSSSMCTHNVYDFASALLYSVETQTTLGYGSRVTNPSCVQSLVLLIVQLVVGVAIDCVVAGLVVDKLTRQRRRTAAVRFSRHAVVCRLQDSEAAADGDRCSTCLAWRCWYGGKSPLLSASVRAVFVPGLRADILDHNFIATSIFSSTRAGCDVRAKSDNDQQGYTVGIELQLDSTGFGLFPWPETIVHRIDATSPLWHWSADDLASRSFELVVVVEGTVESTGVSCQYMTSYVCSDIAWGHVFAPLALRRDQSTVVRCFRSRDSGHMDEASKGGEGGRWNLDCSNFDETVECAPAMPRCSAAEWTNDAVDRV